MADYGLKRRFGPWTAIFAVFASMIGSGIIGNTGRIFEFVGDPLVTISLWAVYGLTAISGALCYAELAARMPHPGGEYIYLRNIFGPLPSFLSGWVSFIAGFSAPASIAAILTAKYTSVLLMQLSPHSDLAIFFTAAGSQKLFAVILILIFSLMHGIGIKGGSIIQNILTVFKLLIMILFIIAGFIFLAADGNYSFRGTFQGYEMRWSGIGPGLLWVLFAFSGWNGASYLAGEIKNPEKNVPRALFWGTLLTTIIYLLTNVIYFLAVPPDEMTGSYIVAAQAARNIFGPEISVIFNAAFCLILLSTISVLIMIGPRVTFAMARDGLFFKQAARLNKKTGAPVIAIGMQALLSIFYILSGTYYQIMTYLGFALSIFPFLTMFALIKLRRNQPEPTGLFRTPAFPLIPLFYASVSAFIMAASFWDDPVNCIIALSAVGCGIPLYFIQRYAVR